MKTHQRTPFHPTVPASLGTSLFLTLLLLFSASYLAAQPSGGPYGPLQQFYPIPDVSGTVYFVAPTGDADASGTALETPTTLEAALAHVVTGDAIVLRGGTYRTGDLYLNQSIVMQPYQDEQPVIKGTYLAKGWRNLVPERFKEFAPGLWAVDWKYLFPAKPDDWWRKELAGRQTPLHKFNNDMVFVDGRWLHSSGWLGGLDENSFFIDYELGRVYLSFDPGDQEVEITAFNQGLIITPDTVNGKEADGKGPTIRGIELSQYAFHILDVQGYFPDGVSPESDHGNDVVGTTIEHCRLSYAGRVAASVLGDHLTMRHCAISNTSTEGLYVLSSDDVLLEKNSFTRNNIEQITGYYPAAVKIFNQSHRVVFNDNLVADLPDSNGVWYDVGNVDGVFTNNWIENVGSPDSFSSDNAVWPSRNGFFFEISKGAIVSGNVFVNNDQGMLILNSSDVKVFNNTFVNSMATFGRDSRGAQVDHFGWHVTTGPAVDGRVDHQFFNNLMVGEAGTTRPLLKIWQAPELCNSLKVPALSLLDHNSYLKLDEKSLPLIRLNQALGDQCQLAFDSSGALQNAFDDYAAHSTTLPASTGSPFLSFRLRNFQTLPGLTGLASPMPIPDELQRKSQLPATSPHMGAYPKLP